jgi:hypothetical protein
MVLLGEKLGGGLVDQSASVLGIVLGVLFLRSSRVHPTLFMASKRLPHTGNVCKMRRSGKPLVCDS